MADESDLASALIDIEISSALSRMRQMQPKTQGTEYCVECSDDIPAGRRQLGFNLCVACANAAEKRKSMYAD